MPFAHLLTALAAAFIGFIHPIINSHQNVPRTTRVLASSTRRTFVEQITSPPPTPFLSPTPTLIEKTVNQTYSSTLIDCIGPDGKHLRITQKACDAFNAAWHHSANTEPTSSTYGQATKVGDHTYELKVPPDNRMATIQEVLAALNQYRQKNGVHILVWNTLLGNYAQNRANYFSSRGSLDEHAGFIDYIHNQDGFDKFGFNHVGENSAYAGPLNATHLIEGIFASDAEHNSNQLNSEWTNVGIGISGIATDVIFASNPR